MCVNIFQGNYNKANSQLTCIQGIVRRILYDGCKVSKLEDLKKGLTDEELKQRITQDTEEPWRPDFFAAVGDKRNQFWVDKILGESLKDAEVWLVYVSRFELYGFTCGFICFKAQMKIKSGLIPEQFWNRESLLEFVLKPLWQSARRGVKIATDPKARSHAGDLAKKGKQDARRNRVSHSIH